MENECKAPMAFLFSFDEVSFLKFKEIEIGSELKTS